MDILPPLTEEDRMISGLCYPLWPLIPPMVFLGARREEPFVHFHALQALALGVVSTVAGLVLTGVMWVTLRILPGGSPTFSGVVGLGVFAFGMLGLFLYLSFVLYTAWRASSGCFLRLPFLGAWAEARMRAHLDIGPEEYSTEPLPATARRESAAEEVEEALPEAGVLVRQHRPTTSPRSEPPAPTRPRRLPLRQFEESEPEQGPGPEAAQAEEGDFQPGLFPAPGAPASRRFKWAPLDPDDEEEGPGSGGGFQAW